MLVTADEYRSRINACGWVGVTIHTTAARHVQRSVRSARSGGGMLFSIAFFNDKDANTSADRPPPISGCHMRQQHEPNHSELSTFDQVPSYLAGDEKARDDAH